MLFRPQWGFSRGDVNGKNYEEFFDTSLGGVPKNRKMQCPSVLSIYIPGTGWRKVDFIGAPAVSFHPGDGGETAISPNSHDLNLSAEDNSCAVLYHTNYPEEGKTIYGVVLVLSEDDLLKYQEELMLGVHFGDALMTTSLLKDSEKLQQLLGLNVEIHRAELMSLQSSAKHDGESEAKRPRIVSPSVLQEAYRYKSDPYVAEFSKQLEKGSEDDVAKRLQQRVQLLQLAEYANVFEDLEAKSLLQSLLKTWNSEKRLNEEIATKLKEKVGELEKQLVERARQYPELKGRLDLFEKFKGPTMAAKLRREVKELSSEKEESEAKRPRIASPQVLSTEERARRDELIGEALDYDDAEVTKLVVQLTEKWSEETAGQLRKRMQELDEAVIQ